MIKENLKKGFTLIELLIVVVIIGIITSIVMFNYGKFNSQTIATNIAYEIALSIREAQTYGLGVRGPDDFDEQFGIQFRDSDVDSFWLFQDNAQLGKNNDGICNNSFGALCDCGSSPGDECITQSQLGYGLTFEALCITINGQENCDQRDLAITFKRPNPNAIFTPSTSEDPNSIESVRIVLDVPRGATGRSITVVNTGQVSVENRGL